MWNIFFHLQLSMQRRWQEILPKMRTSQTRIKVKKNFLVLPWSIQDLIRGGFVRWKEDLKSSLVCPEEPNPPWGKKCENSPWKDETSGEFSTCRGLRGESGRPGMVRRDLKSHPVPGWDPIFHCPRLLHPPGHLQGCSPRPGKLWNQEFPKGFSQIAVL